MIDYVLRRALALRDWLTDTSVAFYAAAERVGHQTCRHA